MVEVENKNTIPFTGKLGVIADAFFIKPLNETSTEDMDAAYRALMFLVST